MISNRIINLCLLAFILIQINVNWAQNNDLGEEKLQAQPANEKVIMCYWATWAFYKNDYANFDIRNFDPFLCTHIIYSFAELSPRTWRFACFDINLDLLAEDINVSCNENKSTDGRHGMLFNTMKWRKDNNPNLKLLMAFGGWDQGSERYSLMARDPNKRRIFISSLIQFLKEYEGFDGIDIDWEYPTQREGAIPEDRENFSLFVKELREAMTKAETTKKYILSSAIGTGKYMVETAYDIPEISKHLDYLNLMLYDLKMYIAGVSTQIGHHSPLYPKKWESEDDKALTIKETIEHFLSLGAPKEKLVMGVPAYGKTYQMFNRSQHNFYDEARGPGQPFKYSAQPGTITYYEICGELEQTSSSTVSYDFDYEYYSAFAYNDGLWIGYDDEFSIAGKVDFMKEKDLAGMMVWTIDFDDFTNKCGGWYKSPITSAIRNRLSFHYGSMHPATPVKNEDFGNADSDENLI